MIKLYERFYQIFCYQHNNDTITTLNLSGFPESSALLRAKIIENNKTLEYVTLSKQGFDNKGVIAIAKALKNNSTIKILNFVLNETKTELFCFF
jgi:hypothetical protein